MAAALEEKEASANAEKKMDRFSNTLDTQRHLRLMRSVLSMSTTMGKDIHVVSIDVETIAVIKKNKKIQHERMRQGNARIIVIHTFVFGLIIFLSLLVESDV